MKKIFSFFVVALMSITLVAGPNDLLWDYSTGAPSSNPDNGLTYGSVIKDGPGVKNGLYGVKLNGSGFAYFSKAAVAGTLIAKPSTVTPANSAAALSALANDKYASANEDSA